MTGGYRKMVGLTMQIHPTRLKKNECEDRTDDQLPGRFIVSFEGGPTSHVVFPKMLLKASLVTSRATRPFVREESNGSIVRLEPRWPESRCAG